MWAKCKIFSIETDGAPTDGTQTDGTQTDGTQTDGTQTNQQALKDSAFYSNMPAQNIFQISMRMSLDSSVRTVPSCTWRNFNVQYKQENLITQPFP